MASQSSEPYLIRRSHECHVQLCEAGHQRPAAALAHPRQQPQRFRPHTRTCQEALEAGDPGIKESMSELASLADTGR